MRTLVAAALALALVFGAGGGVMAQEPDYSRVIAGGAVGWTISGPDLDAGNKLMTYAWGGFRLKKWPDGLALYVAGQHLDIDGVESSSGAKAILSQPIPEHPSVTLLVGGGFLSDLAAKTVVSEVKGVTPTVEMERGFTFDFGISYAPTKRLLMLVAVNAVDRGDLGTDVTLTFASGVKLGAL